MNTEVEKNRRAILRLPSGYGTIRFLGPGRTRAYAVHPPAVKVDGRYIRPQAICYVSNWFVGFAVLTSFHAGTYEDGIEEEIEELFQREEEITGVGEVAERICADYKKLRRRKHCRMTDTTVREVYKLLFEHKFGPHAPVKLSNSRRNQMNAAYKLLEKIHERTLDELSIGELQDMVNKIAGSAEGEGEVGEENAAVEKMTGAFS